MKDSERSPYGLGWEYKRRGWLADDCPLTSDKDIQLFMKGYREFNCTDEVVNKAMLSTLDKR